MKKLLCSILFVFILTLGYSQITPNYYNISYTAVLKVKKNDNIILFVKKPQEYLLYVIYVDSINNQMMVLVDETLDKKTDVLYYYTDTNLTTVKRIYLTKEDKIVEAIFILSDKVIRKEYKRMLHNLKTE